MGDLLIAIVIISVVALATLAGAAIGAVQVLFKVK